MRKPSRLALGLFLLQGLAAAPPSRPPAHCTEENAPTLELSFPRDGMSVEKVCWLGFEICSLDTFYREDLLEELVEKFHRSRHVVFAYADSLRNYLQVDTVWFRNQIEYIDTGNAESLWVSVHSELKGTLAQQAFLFRDRFPRYIPYDPYHTTYRAILDTPFIAFFDTYATPYEMGLGPLDGCFFEPIAYLVENGRIYKRSSMESERMPGIWVAAEDFFRAVGLAARPVPELRPARVGIRRPQPPILGAGPGPLFLYDARGARRGRWAPEAEGSRRMPRGWNIPR